MIKSTPNVWYNIDELYTISSHGKIELNLTMSNNNDTEIHEDITNPKIEKVQIENSNSGLSRIKSESHLHNRLGRILWIFALIIIIIYCIFSGWCIITTLIYGLEEPKLTINYLPISDIPFPAITVCSEHKILKKIQTSFENTDTDLSWYKEWEVRQALCNLEIYGNPPVIIQHDNSIIEKALSELSPPLIKFMQSCEFGKNYCFNHFVPIVTDDGLCFTFNGINSSRLYSPEISNQWTEIETNEINNFHNQNGKGWAPTSGYIRSPYSLLNNSVEDELYPMYTVSHNHELILQLMIKANTEEMFDDTCRDSDGFKIMIHDSATVPQTSTAKVIPLSLDRETEITIKPTLTTVSRDLTLQYPDHYPCYHHYDNNVLDYFQFYTKENCILECLTKYTFRLCDCVAFYMPRNESTPVCNSESIRCLDDAYENFFFNISVFNNCNCLPSCNQISYEFSIASKPYSWAKHHRTHTFKSMSKVRIHYNDFQFEHYKHTLYSGSLNNSKYTFFVINLIVIGVLMIIFTFFGISVINILEFLFHIPSFFIRKKSKTKNDVKQQNGNVQTQWWF